MDEIWHALAMAFAMGWQMLWALILGFFLSGAIQAVVSHREMGRLLPDDRARSIAVATGLGAASSSCSYAAVAVARTIFRKGGDFTAAMAFQFASTNLVLELGIILAVLMGWRFTAAEFVGGPLMILILVVLFRLLLSRGLVQAAKAQAEKGVAGRMEGHASMDMAVTEGGGVLRRLVSAPGFTATSHYFVMDWVSLWPDIVIGLLIAGALGAWVPKSFWEGFFLAGHPLLAKLIGPLVGPLVAIIAFVCSVGNVPLAAVLWNAGASFGGVIAFIFADLIVLPILDIYRRYYGLKMAAFLLVTFYVAMVGSALAVEFLFQALDLVPEQRTAQVVATGISWNYTTVLNIVFLGLAVILVWRFMRTGGPGMIRAMDGPSPHAHPGARASHPPSG
ncbi:permease [Nitrospirillum amazonense]|uniref:permease n=1 Tax=Nitrospirillum amazonense TaxID=28077 RepID=UPI002412DC60|nr:permease [Nitrospirillum amazonense]MDG3443617.1 permease [Nitrospirillum amazonense]